MTTSERVGTPFMHQSSLIIWKKGFKSVLDTASICLWRGKKKFVPYPHVQGVLLERQLSLSYSAIEEQMQLLYLCLYWNNAHCYNHQEEGKNLTMYLYCSWSRTFNNLNSKNYRSVLMQHNFQNHLQNDSCSNIATFYLQPHVKFLQKKIEIDMTETT